MAEFGKLNFSVSLNPTSAFPLDARCYFSSFEDAQNAAVTAEEAGSTNTTYYFGQQLLVVENDVVTWYVIQTDGTLSAIGSGSGEAGTGTVEIKLGNGLYFDDNGAIAVKTTDDMTENDSTPISSHGVAMQVGNINALLGTV